ncbi:hypothetical protein E2C01_018509 [Portunus trituberculatus]|uniref:Uncharacterized protein n=1 Tax=Portunus trituberculatus TaxID=210409 RepID=A0A5B7DWB5_PORTR|nr:hypothetical protein [Portunus trituberculatus]
MRQKGLVSPLPPPQDLPAARGDISLMGRLRYSTHHSPPLAPFGTQENSEVLRKTTKVHESEEDQRKWVKE